MQALGNVATGAIGERGIPLPTAPPLRPSVDLVDRLAAKKARDAARGIPIVEQPAQRLPEHKCKACSQHVHEVSRRGWCDWCEQQAAAAIAPEPAENIPAFIPADPDAEEQADEPSEPVELPDYILDFAILMRDTEGHDDPQIRAARKATANAAMQLHRIFTGWQRRQQRTAEKPKAKPKRRQPKPRGPRRPPTGRGPRATAPKVVDAMIRLYTGPEQLTCRQIAARLDVSIPTVQRYITASGVPKRDDRKGHTGGQNRRTLDPAFVRQCADLYVAGRSIEEIADTIHTGRRQVTAALKDAGVTVRPQVAREPRDNAAWLRDRMAKAGITAADVRAWAKANGVTIPRTGTPPSTAVIAYLAARGQS